MQNFTQNSIQFFKDPTPHSLFKSLESVDLVKDTGAEYSALTTVLDRMKLDLGGGSKANRDLVHEAYWILRRQVQLRYGVKSGEFAYPEYKKGTAIPDWLCWVDGSVKGDKAGIGFYAQHGNTQLSVGKSMSVISVSPPMAELSALLELLKFLRDSAVTRVHIFVDANFLVQWLISTEPPKKRHLSHAVKHLQVMLAHFEVFHIYKVPRVFNREADWLAGLRTRDLALDPEEVV